VGCVVIVLFRLMMDRAMRERAVELGLTDLAPAALGKRQVVLGGLLGMAVVAYVIGWQTSRALANSDRPWGYVLAMIVVAYGFAWLSPTRREGRRRRALPSWAGGVAAALVAVTVTWLFTARRVAGWVEYASVVLFAVTLVAAGAMLVMGWLTDRTSAGGDARFSYGLSVAPVALLMAVALAGIAGWPLGWVERRAVAGMTYQPTREVEQSYWEGVRERMAGQAD
jgi:hypothetical protein